MILFDITRPPNVPTDWNPRSMSLKRRSVRQSGDYEARRRLCMRRSGLCLWLRVSAGLDSQRKRYPDAESGPRKHRQPFIAQCLSEFGHAGR